DPCFFQTPPRGGSPCIITRPSPPSGWPEDLHLQAAEHAQHTTRPARGRLQTRASAPQLLQVSACGKTMRHYALSVPRRALTRRSPGFGGCPEGIRATSICLDKSVEAAR